MPANVDISTDPLVAESASSMETMEKEATEFFAAREAERAALNPVAPALEKAAEKTVEPAKTAAKPPTKAVEKPTPTGKVPGAPTSLKKAETVSEPSKDAAKPIPDLPDLSDTPREFKGGMKGANWNKLHGAIDHYSALAAQRESELAAVRAELESAKASITTAPEAQKLLDTLRQERDGLRQQLEAVAGERIFDTRNKPRRDAEILAAKDAVGPELSKTVEELLNLSRSPFRDAKIAEIAESLPVMQRDELLAAARALNRLELERRQYAAQGGEVWNKMMADAQEQQQRANQERIAKATATFEAELKEWEPVGLSAEDIASARSVYSGQGATLQDASRAALWAVAGPRAAQMASDLQARVAELEGELAKLRGAQPGVGAAVSGALPTTGGDDDFDSTLSYSEAIARNALKSGVRFTPSA